MAYTLSRPQTRFGVLWAIDGTRRAFRTEGEARAYGEARFAFPNPDCGAATRSGDFAAWLATRPALKALEGDALELLMFAHLHAEVSDDDRAWLQRFVDEWEAAQDAPGFWGV